MTLSNATWTLAVNGVLLCGAAGALFADGPMEMQRSIFIALLALTGLIDIITCAVIQTEDAINTPDNGER